MSTAAPRDHYLFGSLESSAKNQTKVQEANFGEAAAGGNHSDLAGFCGELGAQELGMADDIRPGLLRD